MTLTTIRVPLWSPTVRERLTGQLAVRRLALSSSQRAVLLRLISAFWFLFSLLMSSQPVKGADRLASFSCSPNSQQVSKAVFQVKRTWKTITIWDCVIRNNSTASLSITEGHLIHGAILAGVVPISSDHMRTFADENTRRGPLMTAIRIGSLGSIILTGLSAGNFGIKVDPRTGAIFSGLSTGLPMIGRALGERIPSQELFGRMAWREPVGLEPGQTATVTMFSTTTKGMAPIRGSL
jgi:hypothetical protein